MLTIVTKIESTKKNLFISFHFVIRILLCKYEYSSRSNVFLFHGTGRFAVYLFTGTFSLGQTVIDFLSLLVSDLSSNNVCLGTD